MSKSKFSERFYRFCRDWGFVPDSSAAGALRKAMLLERRIARIAARKNHRRPDINVSTEALEALKTISEIRVALKEYIGDSRMSIQDAAREIATEVRSEREENFATSESFGSFRRCSEATHIAISRAMNEIKQLKAERDKAIGEIELLKTERDKAIGLVLPSSLTPGQKIEWTPFGPSGRQIAVVDEVLSQGALVRNCSYGYQTQLSDEHAKTFAIKVIPVDIDVSISVGDRFRNHIYIDSKEFRITGASDTIDLEYADDQHASVPCKAARNNIVSCLWTRLPRENTPPAASLKQLEQERSEAIFSRDRYAEMLNAERVARVNAELQRDEARASVPTGLTPVPWEYSGGRKHSTECYHLQGTKPWLCAAGCTVLAAYTSSSISPSAPLGDAAGAVLPSSLPIGLRIEWTNSDGMYVKSVVVHTGSEGAVVGHGKDGEVSAYLVNSRAERYAIRALLDQTSPTSDAVDTIKPSSLLPGQTIEWRGDGGERLSGKVAANTFGGVIANTFDMARWVLIDAEAGKRAIRVLPDAVPIKPSSLRKNQKIGWLSGGKQYTGVVDDVLEIYGMAVVNSGYQSARELRVLLDTDAEHYAIRILEDETEAEMIKVPPEFVADSKKSGRDHSVSCQMRARFEMCIASCPIAIAWRNLPLPIKPSSLRTGQTIEWTNSGGVRRKGAVVVARLTSAIATIGGDPVILLDTHVARLNIRILNDA